MPHLTLSFLGTFQARLDGTPLTHFRSANVEGLLAFLAIEAAQAHRRDALAALFWPDEAGPVARQNLRQAIYLLQQLLGRDAAAPFLHVARESVQFNAGSDCALDVVTFQAALDADELETAVDLYRGDLLAGLACDSVPFQEWLYFTRERLHTLALNALHTLAERALQQARYTDAQAYARRLLALEPWRESAHRQLMRALVLNGEHNAALEQYARCRDVLAEELGAQPDDDTIALYEQIRAGDLRPIKPPQPVAGVAGHAMQDWGDAPDLLEVFGREAEMTTLEQWLLRDRCRLVTVLGMGGIGKTTLTAKVCRLWAGSFDGVIWRSLVNAPPLADVLQDWMRILTGQQLVAWPEHLDAQLGLVFEQLRTRRCLLVLDNAESIMQSGDRAGHYQQGYEDYGRLFRRMGESQHQSTLILTSREQIREWTRLHTDTPRVQSLALAGLDSAVGGELLANRGLSGLENGVEALVGRYSGNPLALKLVAQTIHDVFGGDVNAFLRDDTLIFDDIRDVLDQQFLRLPRTERDVLLWLAVEREPVSEAQLWRSMSHRTARQAFVEALRSLGRRSLMEDFGGLLGLQNVVTEYVTDTLVNDAVREFESDAPNVLNTHALILAHAKEYVRESQQRMILRPVAERLAAALGRRPLEARCTQMLTRLRAEQPLLPGYLAGNILNLLLYLNSSLVGADFSRLCVWEAYLRGADLPQVNFAQADMTGSVFTDYVGEVTALAFSPNGRLLAAGADNGLIYFWRWDDMQLVGVCPGHEGHFGGLGFSADGRFLVSGGDDQTVRIWEVEHRQPLHVLTGHTGGVTSAVFHPDGVTVVSGSTDRTVRVWDAHTGHLLEVLHGHEDIVSALAFTPDGATLISGSHDATVRLWDWATRQTRHLLRGHTGPVVALSLCPTAVEWGGETCWPLASGSFDSTARVWDVNTGGALATFSGHTAPVMCVAFGADGRTLVSGSDDQTMRVWDTNATAQQANTAGETQSAHVLTGHFGTVNALAAHPDPSNRHRLLVSGSHDRTLRLWDARAGQALAILRGHSKWILALVFTADGRLLAGGSDGRDVRVWDGCTGSALQAFRGHTSLTEKLTFRADGAQLASASWDRSVRVWDVATGQPVQVLHGHTAPVIAAVLGRGTTTGRLVASGGLDQTVRFWEAETGNTRAIAHGHTGRVVAFAFQPNGPLLASGAWDRTICLWDTRRGEFVRSLIGHATPIESVAFDPGGDLLASGSWDHEVRIWDVHTGETVHVLNAHASGLEMVQFSPDGLLLASCACDRLVCIWDVPTGRLLHKLEGHASWVRCIAFNGDGTQLASGSDDGTVRVWDVASGACLQTVEMQDPYAGMNIAGVSGLSAAQRVALKALGAVDFPAE